MRESRRKPLSESELARLDAYWRAANYLTVGQIYLLANARLERPLTLDDVKPRLLGHWGTSPGLNLLYAHLNRVIARDDLDMIYVIGPGHGGPAILANTWLEGSYTETYPRSPATPKGWSGCSGSSRFRAACRATSRPRRRVPSTRAGSSAIRSVTRSAPRSTIPISIVACVVGDGEAETGPLATSWHSNKFLDPVGDGAVLPILHLNGYKIANPTVLARIPEAELERPPRGLRVGAVPRRRRRSRARAPGARGDARPRARARSARSKTDARSGGGARAARVGR